MKSSTLPLLAAVLSYCVSAPSAKTPTSRTPPSPQEIVSAARHIDWNRVCPAGFRCAVVEFDTTVYAAQLPVFSRRPADALFWIPVDVVELSGVSEPQFRAAGLERSVPMPADTAHVSVGIRELRGEYELYFQVMRPEDPFGLAVIARLHWTDSKWEPISFSIIDG